jgi:hypothetical protein
MPAKQLLTVTSIKLEKFKPSKLDRIYEFDGVILVKTKLGDIHSVELEWMQGLGNNYFFKICGSTSEEFNMYYHPEDITHYALINVDEEE